MLLKAYYLFGGFIVMIFIIICLKMLLKNFHTRKKKEKQISFKNHINKNDKTQ